MHFLCLSGVCKNPSPLRDEPCPARKHRICNSSRGAERTEEEGSSSSNKTTVQLLRQSHLNRDLGPRCIPGGVEAGVGAEQGEGIKTAMSNSNGNGRETSMARESSIPRRTAATFLLRL